MLSSLQYTQLHFPAAVVINSMLTDEEVRFQGEAFGSNSFVISFMAIPYFMVQLTNSMGGFVF